MGLEETLKLLYSKEINCGVNSCWDAGWDIWVGQDFKYSERCLSLDEVPRILMLAARACYPEAFDVDR